MKDIISNWLIFKNRRYSSVMMWRSCILSHAISKSPRTDQMSAEMQTKPIELSIVAIFPIIYLEDFQMKTKGQSSPKLNDWPWHVDDSVLKCIWNRADDILEHLNQMFLIGLRV